MTPISNLISPASSYELSGANSPSDQTREQLESVGKDFESVFMSMMIKEMRNSLDEGFFGEESSDSFGGMFDLFIGKHLSESTPLGIADMMLHQYEKNQNLGNQADKTSAKSLAVSKEA